MASSIQSNPVYYSLSSLSSGHNSSLRTVVLKRRTDHDGFGVYIGEDFPSGLYVVTVERNSPATDANIQPGDRVIAVNGQLVSSMLGNPKENVVKVATNAPTLILTVQSTDIFQKLNEPLTNTINIDNQIPQVQIIKQPLEIKTDLESYIKSILSNENVEILSSSMNTNDLFPTSNLSSITLTNSNLLPTELKTSHKHRHHHKHRSRRHHPKQPIRQTKETQTISNDDDDDDEHEIENIPQQQKSTLTRHFPTYPSMGTSHRMFRIQTNEDFQQNQFNYSKSTENNKSDSKPSNINSSTSSISNQKPLPTSTTSVPAAVSSPKLSNIIRSSLKNNQSQSSHMADVVLAAMAATRNIDPSGDKNAETSSSSRKESKDSPKAEETPSERTYFSKQRATTPTFDKRAADLDRETGELTRNPQPPTSYTEIPKTSKPIDNRESPTEGSYNVPNAQQNHQSSSSNMNSNNKSAFVDSKGSHEVRLYRSSSFDGFGFHIQYNKVYYLVQAIEPNSPAETAGLAINDVILKINQQSTENMSHSQFVQIVHASSDVAFIVQNIENYLQTHPNTPHGRHKIARHVPPTNQNNDEKSKTGISKALQKLTNTSN